MSYSPLISQSQYESLKQKRDEIIANVGSDVAHVFVPVCPTTVDDATPRILFVGQATAKYGESYLATYKGAFEANVQTVKSGDSEFFSFVWDVTKETLRQLGLPCDRDAAQRSVGYSNMAKIGKVANDPPKGQRLKMQTELCIATLKTEISTWKPHAVVFLTSDYATGEILLPTFGGKTTWTKHYLTEHVCWKKDHATERHLIWTLHPGRKLLPDLAIMCSATIEVLLQALSP